MNDSIYEHLVQRNSKKTDILVRIVTVAAVLVVSMLAMVYLQNLGLIVLVVLGFLAYTFVFKRLNVEYEYTLLNHDMDVDVIFNREKRKKKVSFDFQASEIIAPSNSPRLQSNRYDKTIDVSSGSKDASTYTAIVNLDKVMTRVIFEPDQGMIDFMKPWMGSKMYLD